MNTSEVFVFGSNLQGFHGAGSAGYAMRGDSRNTWRSDRNFQLAMKSPVGSPNRIGKLAVYGVPKGFQQGHEGASYAIATVTHPGARRSIPLKSISHQICNLLIFAKEHPEYTFKCTPFGCGYAGYNPWEMIDAWQNAINKHGHPNNVILPNYKNIHISQT